LNVRKAENEEQRRKCVEKKIKLTTTKYEYEAVDGGDDLKKVYMTMLWFVVGEKVENKCTENV